MSGRGSGGYFDVREEWGPNTPAAGPVDPGTGYPQTPNYGPDGSSGPPPPTQRPKRVRGIARSVEFRPDQHGVELLIFRVDHYDSAGNRLTPVAVEMRSRRAGRVSDGDHVEVAGKWSRGTFRATGIKNLTTASEVVSWSRWIKWIVLATLAVAVVGCGYVVASGGWRGLLPGGVGGSITVPDVTGETETAAIVALSSAGISWRSSTEASDSVDEGLVIRTVPPAGTLVAAGSEVVVVVSNGGAGVGLESVPPGPGTVTEPIATPEAVRTRRPPTPIVTAAPAIVVVPNVEGFGGVAAAEMLSSLGLVVSVAYEGFCTGDDDALRTDPGAGTSLAVGNPISLVTRC